MSIKVHMKEMKAEERVGDMKMIMIKIRDLPDDTVAQSVEHRCDKLRTWVQILASVRFFYLFRCVLSSQLPMRSVGRSNFDKGFHNLITLIQKRHTK